MMSVLLHLGYGFVRASLSYPFRVGLGEERFRRSYEPEGLRSVSAEHRRLAGALERCVGCGRCDLALPEDPFVHDLARSAWRSPLGPEDLAGALARLDPDDLLRAEKLCPMEVPIAALARCVAAWVSPGEGDGGAPRALPPATGSSTLV